MHTTTAEALKWIAAETGRNVIKDRAELLEHLNDARRLMYSLYAELKLNFWIEGCFRVSEFFEPCLECNGVPAKYYGITLPDHMAQAEKIHLGTRKVNIYNRWADFTAPTSCSGREIRSIDMGGDFPTQLDWDQSKCVSPVFMATDPKDCGKVVHVEYYDETNTQRSEDVRLTTSGTKMEAQVRQFMRPGGIVLPVDLNGEVVAYDCVNGSTIGFYARSPSVPGFRRIKIADACCGDVVEVKGTRRFVQVAFDWDVIETDNKLAILEAYRYNKIMAINSSDAQWIYKARAHKENLKTYIGGDNFRDEGASSVREFKFGDRPRSNRRKLNHSRR